MRRRRNWNYARWIEPSARAYARWLKRVAGSHLDPAIVRREWRRAHR